MIERKQPGWLQMRHLWVQLGPHFSSRTGGTGDSYHKALHRCMTSSHTNTMLLMEAQSTLKAPETVKLKALLSASV